VTKTLLESELFGHARGAFTGAVSARKGLFEEADGGTFFFDEIAETTPVFQAKLLRLIQEGEVRRVGENRSTTVNVRVIAATNVDLADAVKERRFREDLYYRLNVVRLMLPALRGRREDIPLLVEFFLDKHNKKLRTQATLADGAMEAMLNYDFPGNVRELENLIEQAVALSGGGTITVDDILPELPKHTTTGRGKSLGDIVDEAERVAVEAALRAHDGNRERAAESLSISATTLWRKMTRLGIAPDTR
jgi:two-component system response regulator HydG